MLRLRKENSELKMDRAFLKKRRRSSSPRKHRIRTRSVRTDARGPLLSHLLPVHVDGNVGPGELLETAGMAKMQVTHDDRPNVVEPVTGVRQRDVQVMTLVVRRHRERVRGRRHHSGSMRHVLPSAKLEGSDALPKGG